jgi:hypothetical protein
MSGTILCQCDRAALDGVPWVDVAGNVRTALFAGKRFTAMTREVLALRRGGGQLSVAEYFYYRLWDSTLSLDQKRQFVGKGAQTAMHLTCNDHGWYGVTQDKLLFQAAALGAGLPVPALLAVAHPTRSLPGVPGLDSANGVANMLRDHTTYPFFAKPIDGIYSLGVISAERLGTKDLVRLTGSEDRLLTELAAEIAGVESGMLIQRRLAPDSKIAERFGDRLWSVRCFVLLTEHGPRITRAVCKIPAPGNIADNFWRAGNMIAAIDLETGTIARVVRGTGQEMEVDFNHPETGHPIVGMPLAAWNDLRELIRHAALIFPGVRTQSWDVALTDRGPVLLEVNWGGDLNLAQLAYGRGILDETYVAHLRANGYDRRRADRRLRSLRAGLQHVRAGQR